MTESQSTLTPKQRVDAPIKELQRLLGHVEGRTFPVFIDGSVINLVLHDIGVGIMSKETRIALNAGCLVQRRRDDTQGQMYDKLDIETFHPAAQEVTALMLEAMVRASRQAQ